MVYSTPSQYLREIKKVNRMKDYQGFEVANVFGAPRKAGQTNLGQVLIFKNLKLQADLLIQDINPKAHELKHL